MASWFRRAKYTTLTAPANRRIPEGLLTKCPRCAETVIKGDWDASFEVCPKCGHHERLGARRRIEQLLDPGSFVEHDAGLASTDPLSFNDSKTYPQRLAEAREKTGLAEGAVTGTGTILGQPLSLAVMDVNFIGGSMGVAVGEKIARALERAIAAGIPALAVCGSGGARMQEGALSLLQMAKTCAVAARMRAARLPFLTLLTDPTTGGVTASFALTADVVIAEPGALVGFAGPRVIEATIKQILPPGFQRAEFLQEHGFADIVCRRPELRETIGALLDLLTHARRNPAPAFSGPTRAAAAAGVL